MFALVWQEILLITIAVLVGLPLGYKLRDWLSPVKTTAASSQEAIKAEQDAKAAQAFQLAQETQAQLAAQDMPENTEQDLEEDRHVREAEENEAKVEAKAETEEVEIAQPEAKELESKSLEDHDAPAEVLSEADLEAEEKQMATALAQLPKDASAEDKANLVGKRPAGLLTAARDGQADDLKQIKGVGKVIEGKLHGLGIYHFDQIASLSRKEINWVTTFLSFKGRIDREDWLGQARILAQGGETEFSKRAQKTKLYD